jgi:hypothetical protein
MRSSAHSVGDLRHDLDETNGVINNLERASWELTTIIGCDEGVRKNPLRQRQLSSIAEQLAIARGRQSSIARIIEQLEARLLAACRTEFAVDRGEWFWRFEGLQELSGRCDCSPPR